MPTSSIPEFTCDDCNNLHKSCPGSRDPMTHCQNPDLRDYVDPALKDEPIEAEATIIEEEIAPITGLDSLIGEIAQEAAKLAAEFLPHEIKDEDDFKQSKRERTAARKGVARLKAKYADRMGAIKDAVAEADFRMRQAIDPLDAIDKGYKLKVDEYTTRWTNDRIATLREAYEDFAPDLALPQDGADEALVPFHRLLGRYGNKRGEAWTTRTVGEVKATEAMHAAVEEIAKAEKTIDSMVEEAWREQAKARFFRTLDLQATLNEEAEARAQRERVARLERERQERIAAEEAARRQAEACEAEQRAAEDAWLRRQASEPVDPGHARVVAPPSNAGGAMVANNVDGTEPIVPGPPRIVPAPTMAEAPIAPPAPVGPPAQPAPAEYAHEWTIAVVAATRAQMEALAAFMRANGIMFDKVYSGSVATAYEKWSRDNAR